MEISEKAVEKILRSGRSWICLSITDGGCAKYKYVFSFTKPEKYETFYTKGIALIIPVNQIEELKNAKIDYKSSLICSEFFVAENRYFPTTCGCGISVK